MNLKENSYAISNLFQHVSFKIDEVLRKIGINLQIKLSTPPNPEMGDIGFPCHPFAPLLKKSPHIIASEIASLLTTDEIIKDVNSIGSYVNISFNPTSVIKATLGQIAREKWEFGKKESSNSLKWIIEYSSPNTNKPLHLGHIRNNLLGYSIAEIIKFQGDIVIRANLINDRGIHICKSMIAYEKWGNNITPETSNQKGDHLIGNFYVLFEKKFKEEYRSWLKENGKNEEEIPEELYFNEYSKLGREARETLRKWEEGDDGVINLWKKLNNWVIEGFNKTYSRMGCDFDRVDFESRTYLLGRKVIEEGLREGVFYRKNDGAVAFDLSKIGMKDEKILLRSDGTSVYMTQDIGTAIARFEEEKADRMVYVVGNEQEYHFQVLFGILGYMRKELSDACYHLAYGMVYLPEGKMKSREGTIIDADDLMDEMKRLAREEVDKRYTDLDEEEREYRSEIIGQAALKYFLLNVTPKSDIHFDPKKSIDFLGRTGPYCLYTYARIRSLLRKAKEDMPLFDQECLKSLGSPKEIAVIYSLMEFPESISKAKSFYDPSKITEQLFKICKAFNNLYSDRIEHPIVTCEDVNLRKARLILSQAVGYTLKSGLNLLGIKTLEEM